MYYTLDRRRRGRPPRRTRTRAAAGVGLLVLACFFVLIGTRTAGASGLAVLGMSLALPGIVLIYSDIIPRSKRREDDTMREGIPDPNAGVNSFKEILEKSHRKAPKLLFIEPRLPPAEKPIVDDLTRKIAGAYRESHEPNFAYCGFHECSCGALSDTTDHVLPNGTVTNSLCVHYVAYHRHEIPRTELAKIRKLSAHSAEPTSLELHGMMLVNRPTPAPIDPLRQQYENGK